MQKALRLKTAVQPVGKVEFASPELEAGQILEVVVLHESNARDTPSWKSSMAALSAASFKRPKR